MRHFYYRGVSRIVKHNLLNVPEVVAEIYMKEQYKRQKPSDPPVAVSHGFLKNINCLYYAV